MSKGYVDVKENIIEIIKIGLILLGKGDMLFFVKGIWGLFLLFIKRKFFC